MNADTIRDLQHTTPFKPFEIETTGGKRIAIRHTDMLMVGPDQKTLIAWDGPHINIVEVSDVVSIRIIPNEEVQSAA